MKHDWIIEEELIEWLDASGNVAERGREIRLVSPQGRTVGRRLVQSNQVGECYALFQGTKGFSWWEPTVEPLVFVAEVPLNLWRFWTGRSLMTYYSEYWKPDRSVQGKWKFLIQYPNAKMGSRCPVSCTRCFVERYEYTSPYANRDPSRVEWRVCFKSVPSLNAEVPVYSELWLNERLERCHILLNYRAASSLERAFFQVPRKSRQRQVDVARLFGPMSGFYPPLVEEADVERGKF